ncbi:alpha/beta hydrolase fold domain-containing protein [uncultured Pseudokineococcus sp.]|uniref:alpha/beta hydrolase fold domain-containing protein n=1 Tax=uncultured Pseudokineococcus sp. TaxID=1642928 RepID=UPI00260F064A|nr:alpha/beta hydrolase [uncultured Pseudokineococcus sp.]
MHLPEPVVPESLVPAALRVLRASAPYASAEAARAEVRALDVRPHAYGPPRRLPPGVTVTASRTGGVPVHTVAPSEGPPCVRVLYAHGGGWVHEISRWHWALVAQLAAEARAAVTVPVYRLLPHGSAREAVDLAAGLVERLSATGDEVVLAGDSAGGQIALSTALLLRDRGVRDLRTVLVSPALDLTVANPRIPDVAPSDPWLGVEGVRWLAQAWAGDLRLRDPRVSPLEGDMAGLGPMLLLTGTRDILNPDAHLLAGRARAAGVDVTLLEHEGGLHVFPLLPTRSGARARRRIVEALRG